MMIFFNQEIFFSLPSLFLLDYWLFTLLVGLTSRPKGKNRPLFSVINHSKNRPFKGERKEGKRKREKRKREKEKNESTFTVRWYFFFLPSLIWNSILSLYSCSLLLSLPFFLFLLFIFSPSFRQKKGESKTEEWDLIKRPSSGRKIREKKEERDKEKEFIEHLSWKKISCVVYKIIDEST